MELWFFYAIIGSLAIGVNSYLVKVLADRNIDGSLLSFFQGSVYFVIGGAQSFLTGQSFGLLVTPHIVIIYSILIALVVSLHIRLRAVALRYLSSSEYYIGYRLTLTIILALLGILFLGENISESQLFGLVVGSIAITFLFEEDVRLRHSRNWTRALMFFSMSILAGVGIQILGKMQGISDFPFSLLLFVQGVVMIAISSLFDRTSVGLFLKEENDRTRNLIMIITGCLFVYVSAVFNLYAYHAGGSVSVVTKIYAYSLFIPIILSVIFSGEKVTYKKTIAFVLTIVSLYYMI